MKEFATYSSSRISTGDTCENSILQYADISLPINLKPCVELGCIKTECCGEPSVSIRQCPGSCCGYQLVVTQKVSMVLPLEYSAIAESGEAEIRCKQKCAVECKPFKA